MLFLQGRAANNTIVNNHIRLSSLLYGAVRNVINVSNQVIPTAVFSDKRA